MTARTGLDAEGKPQLSAIMIPSGTPGFTVEPAYNKLGWNVSDTHGLTFTGARVPVGNLLGREGHGFKQFLKILDDGRIAISALALGLLQRMLEETTAYAATRTAFARPIGANQGVAFPVADLAVMVESARLLTYKAAWLKDELDAGRRSVAEVKRAASIAKLYSRYELEVKKLFPSESKRAILVVRADLQATIGSQVPFFEQSSLGGQNNLRGFGLDRYIDKHLIAFSIEERIHILRTKLAGVTADFEVAPFLDTGQVFNSFKDVSFQDYRMTPGLGFRAIVRPNVVGRVDYGYSREGGAVFAGLDFPY